MRPVGDAALAMLAAAQAQPDTVRGLARRARVGERIARYTATRMVARGELVVVLGSRPTILAAPGSSLLCVLPDQSQAPAAPHIAATAALAQQLFMRVAQA